MNNIIAKYYYMIMIPKQNGDVDKTKILVVQWSLRTAHTLGADLLSVVERCPYMGD